MACENQEAQAGVASGCHLHKAVLAQGEQSAKDETQTPEVKSKTKPP